VPVVLFSSVEENELARRSSSAGASGYIWKGAGMSELVRRCKEFLEPAA
jgi:DNA-binding NarL/FixJ family response regulator